ncbi:MAG TPA: GAF domain-containing protein [Rhizomicrobium sp.]|jgi:GAF domain-containing protein|nr:GAF domain-containing protein [Rhizomicrobium sp.]
MTFAAVRPTGTKPEIYHDLALQARGLVAGERDAIANAANLAALLFNGLEDLNWAGFYFLRGDVLVLGPFQGNPACVRIELGKGVCGTAAAQGKTLIVEDVNEFPGHIACDVASQSEIVIPLIRDGEVIGVLDIDAPIRGRFDEADRAGLEKIAGLWLTASDI